VPPDDDTAARLLRVTLDDPEYRRQAAAEAEFWQAVHPLGLEATESQFVEGPVDRYVNARFTGEPDTDWTSTIARRGTCHPDHPDVAQPPRGLGRGVDARATLEDRAGHVGSPARLSPAQLRDQPGVLGGAVLVGDTASAAGLLRPGIAFGVYRKRRA
jgi:hypothetical protein